MNSELDDTIYVQRKCLSTIGIWPLDKKDTYKQFRFALSTWLQYSLTIQAMFEMYTSSGGMAEKMDMYLVWVCAILACARHTQIHVHRDRFREGLHAVIRDWATIKEEEFLKIMQGHAHISKWFSKALTAITFFSFALLLTRMFVTNAINLSNNNDAKIEFILPTWFLTGGRAKKWFWPWTGYQIFQCCPAILCGPGVDAFIFTIVSHLCGQFEILNLEWKMLGKAPTTVENLQNKKTLVRDLIKKHMYLVNLGENLRRSLADLFFVQMAINIICIGASGLHFLLSLKTGDWITLGLSVLAINVLTSQSLVYCYLGEYLRNESEAVVDAIYCSFWYNLERSNKSSLLFVMAKAYQPVALTGGKFFEMTMQTFVTMVKTAFSYLSVLRIMIED